jgi:hypothetical protein
METERRCLQRILKESTLDVKRKTIIGCWNVRTMREVGQLSQVAEEAKVYHVEQDALDWNPQGYRRRGRPRETWRRTVIRELEEGKELE